MKKFLSLLLTGVMSAMLLAGCGTTSNDPDPASSSTPPAVEEERSITIAQSANFSMGFTPGVQSYEATYYMNNFYEGLVEYWDGEYLPCLATDWAASDDGLTYTFHLRDDVQFNDGTTFNAEAVKLYFDNMKPVIGTSANYGQLDMLTTEITVDDEYTVSFHLSRPYYNVLNDLSMVMPRGILSAAAFNEDGSLNTEYLMTHTPGTGPYMFESVNETATEYTFVKNPNYWGEEPDVDRFTVKVIPESKVAAMRAGEVDFIMGSDTLDANSYLELSQVEGITGVISAFRPQSIGRVVVEDDALQRPGIIRIVGIFRGNFKLQGAAGGNLHPLEAHHLKPIRIFCDLIAAEVALHHRRKQEFVLLVCGHHRSVLFVHSSFLLLIF